MTHASVLLEQTTGPATAATGMTRSALATNRGVRGCAIAERALDRLERHLGWRPTRALAARFLDSAETQERRPGADRWFVRFRVFGQVLLAEMRMSGEGDGGAVWVATHVEHGPGLNGRARLARVCTG